MKTKMTKVTIGIPAFNEAINIRSLLTSILKQKGQLFSIEEIIVISDGSRDNTANEVKSLIKEYPIIRLINDKIRKGKTQRLNQIFKLNKSDIVMIFDADTVLSEPYVINKIVSYFGDHKVVLVNANKQPIKGETILEKIINEKYNYWYQIRKEYDNGCNIYNVSSSGMALTKKFSKAIKLPKTIISTSPFLYFSALQTNSDFEFAKNAVINFRSPDNLKDYILQVNRVQDDSLICEKYFGKWIHEKYKLPAYTRLTLTIKAVVKTPAYVPCYFILKFLTVLSGKTHEKNSRSGTWKISPSTKKEISISF